MKMTVFERLQLQNLLPAQGSFVTLKLVRKLRESLAFSEKEIAEIDFKNHWKCEICNTTDISAQLPKCPSCGNYMQPAGMVNWDEAKAVKVTKDIHLGSTMLNLCRTSLKKLSDENKLTEQTYSLYEKFCVDVEGEEDAK